MTCGRCGFRLFAFTRAGVGLYPDGTPKREYRCRQEAGYSGCGRNHIDAQAAERFVREAVVTRMSDPRHTAAVAERAAKRSVARAERLKELAFLEAEADELSAKTARWGVKRVDAAMESILARACQVFCVRAVLAVR